MVHPSFYSTKTLNGRLAMFFTAVALVMGAVTCIIFIVALQWSEDRVGERRIQIDRNEAVNQFIRGETGKITIDVLTDAYNDLALVPTYYHRYIADKQAYVGEVGDGNKSRMLLVSHYFVDGNSKPLYLLSKINEVEFGSKEVTFAGLIVLSCVAIMLFIFGALLFRLSEKLIEPINNLIQQLDQYTGDLSYHFTIKSGAAVEFQSLADELNQYRHEIHALLKREQAFARYASHELRTPLTIVRGADKLLAKSDVTEFQRRQVQRIEDATDQMSTMVDALLGLVRYERDQFDTPFRLFSQHELTRIINQNATQADKKAIALDLTVHSEPSIQATTAVMTMIVGNLLRNAIAATNQGKITVTLHHHSLCIADEGEGLAKQPNKEGHGLGLMIVEDLCHRYHWHFSLTNRIQGGCLAVIHFCPPDNETPLPLRT